ncbi:hypothetical protein Acsp06_60250 [Actinomycetospora sp. NBRC 106375]|nr:hypothetical protein Acsp06_60250 [Actinomycetospora sp. NBRC 106375]
MQAAGRTRPTVDERRLHDERHAGGAHLLDAAPDVRGRDEIALEHDQDLGSPHLDVAPGVTPHPADRP